MGRLFTPVFERAGYDVLVSGRSTLLTNTDLAEQCDLVIVSVPIHDTVRVIGEISPVLTKDQLLCDFTSLKTGPVAAMLKSKAKVIGLHPLFGPTVQSLRHQTIIVCPARAEETVLRSLLTLFCDEGAQCTIATPEQHDRMMAVVQGLTHFVTLTVAETLRRLDTSPSATEPYRSPVYQIEMGLVGRLLFQDPDLYGDMLTENPYVPPVLAACHDSLSRIQRVIGDRDPGAFRELFLENARFFAEYSQKATEETDFLIDAMVRR